MTVRVLGDHRLACGDCTDANVTDALFTGQQKWADFATLDPPYGAALDADAPRRAEKAGTRGGRNPIITEASASWDVFSEEKAKGWLMAALTWCKPKAAIVCWTWDAALADVLAAGADCGLRLAGIMTWCKPSATAKFWKHTVLTKATEFAVIFRQSKGIETFGDLPRNFLVHTMTTPERARGGFHPSPKPELVMRLLIERFAPVGGIVYDPFAGSGSALIAAQQTGRRCFGVEMSADYCEKIADRYHAYTDLHGTEADRPDLRHGRQARLAL